MFLLQSILMLVIVHVMYTFVVRNLVNGLELIKHEIWFTWTKLHLELDMGTPKIRPLVKLRHQIMKLLLIMLSFLDQMCSIQQKHLLCSICLMVI